MAVPLEKDEVGALMNLYVPLLIAITSFVIYGLIILVSKKARIRQIVLTLLVCLNISIGILLNFSFDSFNKHLLSGVLPNAKTANNKILARKGLEINNLDGFPAANRVVFSYIYNPSLPVNHGKKENTIINHDISKIRIKNKEKKSVTIDSTSFSANGLWTVFFTDEKKKFPLTLSPGDSVDLNVKFTAKALNKRVESFWWKAALKFQHSAVGMGRKFNFQLPYGSTCANINGQLILHISAENAILEPIQLTGIWEYKYENDWEPGLQRILNSLNFKTKVGFTYFDNGLHGEGTTNSSDEITADYFEVADSRKPVKIRKIASYHGCCTIEDSDTLALYDLNKQLTKPLQYTNKYSGQMLLPAASELPDSKLLANLSGPFAVKIGLSYTDRAKNHDKKIGIRVWKAIDEHSQVINHAYILGSDYLGKKGTNYDYQDNVYFIENIKLYNKANNALMAQK
ncbi:hypothetical protein [Mucilaginibacter psychrotolerans]|uniref:Uncharacterized protein n=1 Tax=Mucilaginibacter psychrotolerans TaxID=1524096 RepID=A0A4Y8SLE4_9SPHI|nr:hypothetical protein [Mucilaginibacter psychrotolerans]TFF39843.1 hypothetical protein E2R66_05630 [Mucilaginibacter psychrotolerans]